MTIKLKHQGLNTVVVMVLRSRDHKGRATTYSVDWAVRLRNGILRHLSYQPRFVLLTDVLGVKPFGFDVLPLTKGWPGWWSKMEGFRPGLFPAGSRVVYSDLDVAATGSWDELLRYDDAEFAALRGFVWTHLLNSSIMSWRVGAKLPADLWSIFSVRAKTIMSRFRREGDQQFISAVSEQDAVRLQDVLPDDYVVSLKQGGYIDPVVRLPEGTRAVVCHGNPKPNDLPIHHPVRAAWEGVGNALV